MQNRRDRSVAYGTSHRVVTVIPVASAVVLVWVGVVSLVGGVTVVAVQGKCPPTVLQAFLRPRGRGLFVNTQ